MAERAKGGEPNLTAVDLFSGAGGLSLGLESAGFHVLCAFDNWKPAVESHAENFDHPLFDHDLGALSARDLRSLIDAPPAGVDLVVGGPPCQGFSVQRIGDDSDSRNDLILSFAGHVLALRPRMFVLENVLGLLGKRGAALTRQFLERLEEGGYGVACERLNLATYGVPQIRRRVLIVGWRQDSVLPFQLPEGPFTEGCFKTVREAIGDLAAPPLDGTPATSDPLHRRMRLSQLNRERLAKIPPGGGFEHLSPDLRVDCHRNGPERIGHRNVYGRLHPDQPAGTVTARFDSFTRGKFAHPFEDRNISLREGARLQTFRDDHVFLGTQEEIAALIGNAVPPLFAERIAEGIRDHLNASAVEAKRSKAIAAKDFLAA